MIAFLVPLVSHRQIFANAVIVAVRRRRRYAAGGGGGGFGGLGGGGVGGFGGSMRATHPGYGRPAAA